MRKFATDEARDALARQIADALDAASDRLSDLARECGIERTQLWRYASRPPLRFSDNLGRVCEALKIDAEPYLEPASGRRIDREPSLDAQARLLNAVTNVWDHTPEHADRLSRLVIAVGPMLRFK